MILFDTEYTAWAGSAARKWSEPWEHREILQIAAIRVLPWEDFREQSSFDRLVQPKRNLLLSGYITALTGIQQADVDSRGVDFAEAFAEFYTFCEAGHVPLLCWGDDPAVLRENLALNGMPLAAFPAGIYDIRVVFEQAGIDTRRYTSGTVHQAVGAAFDQAAHNALNDVRSLAVTLRVLLQTGTLALDWIEVARTSGRYV